MKIIAQNQHGNQISIIRGNVSRLKTDGKLTNKFGNTPICGGNKISQTCKNL